MAVLGPVQHLALVDTQALIEASNSIDAKRIKREAIKDGYTNQLSLYGIITDTVSTQSSYRRVEVLSDHPWTLKDVQLIRNWFVDLKPYDAYTIWLYRQKGTEIRQVGSYR